MKCSATWTLASPKSLKPLVGNPSPNRNAQPCPVCTATCVTQRSASFLSMSELTKALCAFHQQVGTIHKDAAAQYGRYADLAGVLSTVLPVLSKNGLSISQTFDADRNLITTLSHVSGETQVSTLPMIVPQGRNELHSWGASVTYMRRYGICSILCLVADIDTDGNVGEPASVPSAGHSKPAPKAAAKP